MKKVLFFHNLTTYAWKRICQQLPLLAVLSMLFFALTLGVGPVARTLLSQGVGFSGMTLAVTAPEGDGTGDLLENLTASMRDIRSYCRIQSMDWEDASQALKDGELTAVLVLPEDFIGGVMDGNNPDLTLVVSPDRPLESLLTLWVGQSAADLLASAQKGIYAVLDLYPKEAASGLTWDQVMTDINLKYITLTLNRQELFRQVELQATGAMDLESHYALSLLIFLTMSLPPLLMPLLGREDLPFRRRLYALGQGCLMQYGSVLTVCFWVLLALTGVPAGLLTNWNLPGMLALALFAACYGCFCCQAVRSSAGCGGLAMATAGVCTFLAGGILPPALLPGAVKALSPFSPVQMLREVLYLPVWEWQDASFSATGGFLWTLVFFTGGLLLYRRRLMGKETDA